jgi:hypothetical protein
MSEKSVEMDEQVKMTYMWIFEGYTFRRHRGKPQYRYQRWEKWCGYGGYGTLWRKYVI